MLLCFAISGLLLEAMRNSLDESSDSLCRAFRERSQLRRQIEEMDKFLADYGLTWAGFRAPLSACPTEKCAPETSTSSQPQKKLGISKSCVTLKVRRTEEKESLPREVSSKPAVSEEESSRALFIRDHPSRRDLEIIEESTPEPEGLIYFDVAVMLSKIEQLNASAESDIVSKGRIYRFEPPRRESLLIYKNGIFFKNGPLREYSLRATRDFCNDIIDGYFPYELRDEFPEGLHFDVVDCSTVVFNPRLHMNDNGIGSKHALNSARAAQISPRRVLSNLPEKVIHSGKVIEIRPSANASRTLHRPKASLSPRRLGSLPCEELQSEAVASMSGTEGDKSSIIRVQCIFERAEVATRGSTMKDTYLVHVLPSDTIGTLRGILSKATSNSRKTGSTSTSSGDEFTISLSQVHGTDDTRSPRIRICQRFPNLEFTSNSMTIAEAGLSRNHTLYCSFDSRT